MQTHTNNNISLLQSNINSEIIYMLSFSHFINEYWKNNERNFNGLINQEGTNLTKKIISVQTKREIFQILSLEEIKLIIRDLYARRSVFIHFSKNPYEFDYDGLKKIYYKILKFKIGKNDFDKKKIKKFIAKYLDYLSAMTFLYWNEKNVFFFDTKDKYEQKLMKTFSMWPKHRYNEMNVEAVNWYNHYFFNKENNLKSGNRYDSYLSHYTNFLNNLYQSQTKFYFKTYIIHKKIKIIENNKYLINKRHKNNSIVITFDTDKRPEDIEANFAFLDYRIFLIIKFQRYFHKMNENFEEDLLRKIVKQVLINLRGRKKVDNYFSVYDFLNILFSTENLNSLKSLNKISKRWFDDRLEQKHKKFAKNKLLHALIYINLNQDKSFSIFLTKYKNTKISEFLLYYFVSIERKDNFGFIKIWELFLKDYESKILSTKFLTFKITKRININKHKHIYLVGTTKEFYRYYQLIDNRKHILKIARNNRIKNNKEYSIKYVWRELEKIILFRLLNKDENLYIVRKYEEIKERSKFMDSLFHNYRNYIAHLGNGNENLFVSYKDYVRKKWSVKELIKKLEQEDERVVETDNF